MLLNGLNVLNFMRIFPCWEKKNVTLKKKKALKARIRALSGMCGGECVWRMVWRRRSREPPGRRNRPTWWLGVGAGGTSAWQRLGPPGGRWAQLWGREVEKLNRVVHPEFPWSTVLLSCLLFFDSISSALVRPPSGLHSERLQFP